MTSDAVKRLDAIAEAEDLGSGFILATHDLEIRGAGELLGDQQTGNLQTIGYSLYMEMLDHAVNAIRDGKTPRSDGNSGLRVVKILEAINASMKAGGALIDLGNGYMSHPELKDDPVYLATALSAR